MKYIVLIFCMILTLLIAPHAAYGQRGTVQAQEPVKYALVMKALSNPFFAKMAEGAKQYAPKQGLNLEVFGVQRETDIDYQIAIVEDLIHRHYKAIIIAPADSKRLVPVCKKALDAGIVVINIDNPLDKHQMGKLGISIPFVGSDNFQGASLVGDSMRKKLGNSGRVIVIEGIRGVKNADLRTEGFKHAISSGDSKIKVIASESANWHTDEAFALTVRLLQKHGNVDGIFCANDQMALGAVKALDVLGISDSVIIGGYDNITAVRGHLSTGRIYATIEQHPELMGQYGLRLAAEAVSGNKIHNYTATPLDIITSDGFGRKIGFSVSEQGTVFFDELMSSTRQFAEMHGAELIIRDAKRSDANQLVDISELIKQKMDVLIVNPTNSTRISAGIELAKAAGVKVITVDRAVQDVEVDCHITSDNIAGGKMAAEYMAEKKAGKAKIVELIGIAGTSAAHERGQGFENVVSSYAAMEIVSTQYGEFDRENAKLAIENLLAQNISFDAIFAHNDLMALGAVEALSLAGVEPLPMIIGFDAIPEAIKAIQRGNMTATIAQMPDSMGKTAVNIAMELIKGETVPAKVLIGLRVIDR